MGEVKSDTPIGNSRNSKRLIKSIGLRKLDVSGVTKKFDGSLPDPQERP